MRSHRLNAINERMRWWEVRRKQALDKWCEACLHGKADAEWDEYDFASRMMTRLKHMLHEEARWTVFGELKKMVVNWWRRH